LKCLIRFTTETHLPTAGREVTEKKNFCLSRGVLGTNKRLFSHIRGVCWPKAREFMENRYLPRTLRGIFDRFSMRTFPSVRSVSRTSPPSSQGEWVVKIV